MKVKNEKQITAKKQQILTIAEEIIMQEGIDNLSIRKIAAKMNQTPGILYHYYKDKDEIVLAIVERGYQDILTAIRINPDGNDPVIQMKERLRNYIHVMLERKELFLLLMQSTNRKIQDKVNILTPGIEQQRGSMNALCQGIREGVRQNVFVCENVEARAQVIWCAAYGLIGRIITENPEEVQRELLIEEHLNMIIQSLEGR